MFSFISLQETIIQNHNGIPHQAARTITRMAKIQDWQYQVLGVISPQKVLVGMSNCTNALENSLADLLKFKQALSISQ